MSKASIEVNVQKRQSGRHHNRTLRAKGLVPCVIYGPKTKNVDVVLDERIISKYGREEYQNQFLDLKMEGQPLSKMGVLIKEITVDPVNRKPLHADLFAPDPEKKMKTKVKVQLEGKAKGLIDGGILKPRTTWVEILCWPHEIPEAIHVDVSAMGIGSCLRVSDLKLDGDLKILTQGDLPLVTMST